MKRDRVGIPARPLSSGRLPRLDRGEPRLERERPLADVIAAIYAAAPEPEQWPNALQAVADGFGDMGANLFFIRDGGAFGMVVSPALKQLGRQYDEGWWRHDIRSQRALERGYGAGIEAITDRHVTTPEERATHPFYQDYLRGNGMGLFAAVPVSPDSNTILAMTIQRSMDTRAPYTDEELDLVKWIGRHVENALRLSARLITAELTSLAFGEALSRLDAGVFVLDPRGRILARNEATELLLGDSLVISGQRLAARFEPAASQFDDTLQAVISSDVTEVRPVSPPVVLHGFGDDTFSVAYFLPVRTIGGHIFERMLVDARVIVVVRRARRGDPLDPSLVRDLLNLTFGEARVAALVGAGIQPKAVAATLGITEQSTRTVLKRVFAKTGVSRQSDLAGILTQLVLR
jgi:DNA-binding CsgD family transcriptional regulator/PAS domain-containing protein